MATPQGARRDRLRAIRDRLAERPATRADAWFHVESIAVYTRLLLRNAEWLEERRPEMRQAATWRRQARETAAEVERLADWAGLNTECPGE